MVASFIPKKSKTKKLKATPYQVAQVETATELASELIKHWARDEANRILSAEPVIVQFKGGYKVGKFTVTNQSLAHWIVTDQFGDKKIDFAEKRAAVLYCILFQLNKYNQAQNLLAQDQTYAKLHNDFIYYEHCIRRAAKRKDMFTVDVTVARREDTKHKLEIAKNDLQKTLTRAKYIKIWDNRL